MIADRSKRCRAGGMWAPRTFDLLADPLFQGTDNIARHLNARAPENDIGSRAFRVFTVDGSGEVSGRHAQTGLVMLQLDTLGQGP